MNLKSKVFKICVIISTLIILIIILALGKTASRKVDYSQYPFTDVSWERQAEHDVETIIFSSDGSYAYYCACGNPVNDSDLNEGYTYDDETKIIKIKYIETTEETVPEIKIEECDGKKLKLNFNGEIREFVIDLS